MTNGVFIFVDYKGQKIIAINQVAEYFATKRKLTKYKAAQTILKYITRKKLESLKIENRRFLTEPSFHVVKDYIDNGYNPYEKENKPKNKQPKPEVNCNVQEADRAPTITFFVSDLTFNARSFLINYAKKKDISLSAAAKICIEKYTEELFEKLIESL